MGCHTWVYHTPTKIPKDIINEAKKLAKEENEKIANYNIILESINDVQLNKFINTYIFVFNTLVRKKHINRSELYQKCFDMNNDESYNEDIHNLMEHYSIICFSVDIANLEDIDDIRVTAIKQNNIDMNNKVKPIKYINKLLSEKHNVSYRVYVNESKNIYALPTLGHPNFRVYGYPEEIFYDRETLESFLIDPKLTNLMTCDGTDKKDNYQEFCTKIKNSLDELYKEYGKLIIYFG